MYPDALANLEAEAPLSASSRGFAVGHDWLIKLWALEMPDDMDQEVGSILAVLTFFGSRQLADAYLRECLLKGRSLGALAKRILALLPEAIEWYAFIGRTALANAYAAAADEPATEPRRTTKVGRNALCPCGSGKKFKKCHGTGTQ